MELLSNIITASVILSILIVIIIYYIFNEYSIELDIYIKLFIYITASVGIFISYYKKFIIEKYGYKTITAAAEVFNEITDSQELNGVMPLYSTINNEDELIIDNIPTSITCNNIVQNNHVLS